MKFLLKVFHLFTIKTLFQISKKISNKERKPQFTIIFDMIFCALKYQASFHDYLEFEFYNLNEIERKTYLTRGKNNKIIKKFNNKEFFHFLDNKLEFNNNNKAFIKRDFLDMNKANLKDFKEFIYNKDKIIIKPIYGEGGRGIKIVELKNQNLEQLFNYLLTQNDFFIEEVISQHQELNNLYSKSVNSLRIFTFCKDNQAFFLTAILKIGNGEVMDNFSSGGMYAFLNNDGKVITSAIDQKDDIYKVHPESKVNILGFQVPYMKEGIELVKEASLKIPEIGYIGWDVAITNDGPIIIEGNSYPGIFQIKASLGNKVGLIPKYEEIMKIKLN